MDYLTTMVAALVVPQTIATARQSRGHEAQHLVVLSGTVEPWLDRYADAELVFETHWVGVQGVQTGAGHGSPPTAG